MQFLDGIREQYTAEKYVGVYPLAPPTWIRGFFIVALWSLIRYGSSLGPQPATPPYLPFEGGRHIRNDSIVYTRDTTAAAVVGLDVGSCSVQPLWHRRIYTGTQNTRKNRTTAYYLWLAFPKKNNDAVPCVDRYHLLTNNCNNFADEIAGFLSGKGVS